MAARGVAGGLIRRAIGGPGQPQGPQEPSAVGPGPTDESFYSSIHQYYTSDHPSTDDNFAERADGDPDDVDPHEFNDGEDSLAKDDVSEVGSDGFAPEVEQALEEAMPSLLKYYHSEESGESDPAIQKLIDILQQHDPQLLDEEVSPEHQALLDQHIPKISAALPQAPVGPPTALAPMGPGNPANPATGMSSCPSCGAQVAPGSGICPQCGGGVQAQPNMPLGQGMMAPGTAPMPGQATGVLAANQGPHSIEQIQAVADLLAQTGRQQEIPNLIAHPELYENELAQITQRQQPPQADPDPGPPPPMPDPSQMGGMPPGGAPPGAMPMQASRVAIDLRGDSYQTPSGDEHHFYKCPNCNGQMNTESGECYRCGYTYPYDGGEVLEGHEDPHAWARDMGVPSMNADWGPRHQGKEAADSIAPRCPKCDSATTETLISDIDPGNFRCHSCGHAWKRDDVLPTKAGADIQSDPHALVDAAPAADQVGQDDMAQDINPGAWQTADGQPLKVGQQYEMYSEKYDVPDLVQVTAIKPDSIEYTLQGEYGLEHRTEVTKQEAQMDGLTFQPVDGGAQDDQPVPGDPSMMDMSTPDVHPDQPVLSRSAQWSHLAGKKYTPMQQREFIDEPGVARNADKLNLKGTHYEDQPRFTTIDEDSFLFGL
jgi:hypothetical protein